MIAQTISHYKILEKLGAGGMGVVYKAEDTKLKRNVALKFLPPELTRDLEAKKRFVNEAQAASGLDHQNICTIHEIDETQDGQTFIVMAYYEGETLKEKFEHAPIKIEEVVEIAIQIAQGLAKAHEQLIVHRDIKPANIMITSDGVVKILDFGLAKLASRTKVTKTGTTMGTIAYMSPEQARGEDVDLRSDIWSFGVVLYEAVTGQLPFKGEHEQVVMYAILNEDPERLMSLRSEIPRELEQIVLKALEKDREKRYQSSDEILQSLKRLSSAETLSGAKDAGLWMLPLLLKRPRIAITILAIIILLAMVIIIPYQRLLRYQRANELLQKIERLAEEGKYFEAYKLAVGVEKQLKNDSTLVRLMPIVSDSLTIITQPEGAEAYLQRFAPNEHGEFPEREYIGVTPNTGLRMARGDYHVYLEKPGYASMERTIATTLILRGFSYIPRGRKIEVRLLESEKVPENMVFVPGGKYRLVSWDLPTAAEVQLDDYFVDKYEVSNKQYKKFIEVGGYVKKQYWKYPFIKDGKEITWEEALSYFKDRVGLPGPRSWVNQEFPQGKENHPVADITWYEAAAYAEFVGKNLPTIFQWEKAARDGKRSAWGLVMPWGMVNPKRPIEHRANFEGKGTVDIDEYEFGVSPYGCYNMAGNVKEWCLNEISSGYAATGGSWEDPYYIFGYYSTYPSFYTSRAVGFRCVINSAGATSDQGAMKINLEDRIPSFSPTNEATFRSFLSYYKYDKRPLDARIVETKETADWIREKIIFAGIDDDRIIAYLYLPKRIEKPFQCLNFDPHGAVYSGAHSAAEGAEYFLTPHIKSGRAVLAMVPKGAQEREREPGYAYPETNTVKYREQVIHRVTEFSIGLDYLETRNEIDMEKLAYIALSKGTGSGLISPAVESRYCSVVLLACGLKPSEALPEANAINFVPYFKAPTLLLNGRYDEALPAETSARPLFNLLPEPKKLALVDGGHVPPIEERVPIINEWLDKTLGPVKFISEGDGP
ncbi:MAG: hypothetical protein CV087_23600 [Candidatus Brocadia sp. WS118]|nr:MAG: hypothetical protein CV087_23600 [Candidatus Brocadia sp. WS118]